MIRVKICGNVTLKDTMAAVEAGADAVGFVFYAKSPRVVSPKAVAAIVSHLPPLVTPVGVFVNENPDVVRQLMSDCGLALAQLHGEESPQYCAELRQPVIKGIRVRSREDLALLSPYRVKAILLDAYVEGMVGGTGTTFDWSLAVEAKAWGPIILAGGLTPENVVEAVSRVQPYGVDVSSGVESAPGVKDPAKVRTFVENVKCWGA
jgi:phosphoribosylanthranilate isomerase